MDTMSSPHITSPSPKTLPQYSLIDALLHRRSRRFGKGMTLNGGPLAYASQQPPEALTETEEAALAFAACGVTGTLLADLPFQTGNLPRASGGNIMMNLVGRTVASGDASHSCVVFVINDDGAWMLKRPQDHAPSEIPGLIRAAHQHEWADLFQKSRVKIANERLDIPREVPYIPPFNKWSSNVAGTTFFLPVAELSGFYINVLLAAFNEENGNFIIDERNNFQPAGLGKFARSKGGHLNDDLNSGQVGMLGYVDDWMLEFAAIEQGGVLQNLGLMCEALGLGGFAHFAAYPYVWFQKLGFRMIDLPFSRTVGAGRMMKVALKLLNKDIPMPTAVGLERDGNILIKPFCPPYYRNMEEAVLAFIDRKYAKDKGIFHAQDATPAWRDAAAVKADIPRYSDQCIAATIACCEYAFQRYGRIPPGTGPFRSVLAFQAHHLDADYYEKFYTAT
jgi:hypothetical protein